MSSTSAVGVLAQGLRDLRDFAEGPEDEELRERTGLTAGQIDAALGGEHLPTREVTLALVEAWEGDVEAWREYWGQIAELAEEEEGEGRAAGEGAETPAPPEPSTITPIPEEAPEPGQADQASAEAGHKELAEADQDGEESAGAGAGAAAEQDAEAEADAEARAEADADAEAEADAAARAETEVDAGAEEEAEARAEAEADAEPPARAESESVAVSPGPVKKSPLAKVGIPVLLFAVGVGVGAFGDHALNSKQSSSTTAASVPPVASSSRPSHTAALSPSSSGASSSASSAGSAPSPTDSSGSGSGSTSASSTVAPGTVLGAYVGIQLASGYSVNFLNDPYHPSAGTSNGPDTMGFFAGSFVDGRFYADRVAILDPTDTGSFNSCLNDTRYQHDVLLSQISTGSSFCITTGTGHLVLVTVRRLPSSTDANPYAALDVTVWQGGSAT